MDDRDTISTTPPTDPSFRGQSSTILNEILSQIQNYSTPTVPNGDTSESKTLLPGIFENNANNSSAFPSNDPFLFPESQNTPLSARESDLFTVTNDYNYNPDGGMLTHSGADLTSLGWIIPTVIGVVAAMVILALLCFFGVRALEFKCMNWCNKNCSCCCEAGEERNVLTSSQAINQTEMTNYKSAFTPDGDEW